MAWVGLRTALLDLIGNQIESKTAANGLNRALDCQVANCEDSCGFPSSMAACGTSASGDLNDLCKRGGRICTEEGSIDVMSSITEDATQLKRAFKGFLEQRWWSFTKTPPTFWFEATEHSSHQVGFTTEYEDFLQHVHFLEVWEDMWSNRGILPTNLRIVLKRSKQSGTNQSVMYGMYWTRQCGKSTEH